MGIIDRTKCAASVLLIAGLVAASDPATAANVAVRCKAAVSATGNLTVKLAHAKTTARTKWTQAVSRQYGPNWASLSRARNTDYDCQEVRNHWQCAFSAKPCAVSTPLSTSPLANPGVAAPTQ